MRYDNQTVFFVYNILRIEFIIESSLKKTPILAEAP